MLSQIFNSPVGERPFKIFITATIETQEWPLDLNLRVDGVLEALEVELFVGGVLVDDEQVVVFAGDDEAEIELKIGFESS